MFFGLTYLLNPMVILATFKFNRSNILISPISENYTYIILAYFSLLIGLCILAWRKNSWTIITMALSVFLFGGFLYVSTIGYFAVHEDYVILKSATSEKKFQWHEIGHIKHDYHPGGIAGVYHFTQGKEVIRMEATGQFTYAIQQKIKGLAFKHNVKMDEVLIE